MTPTVWADAQLVGLVALMGVMLVAVYWLGKLVDTIDPEDGRGGGDGDER